MGSLRGIDPAGEADTDESRNAWGRAEQLQAAPLAWEVQAEDLHRFPIARNGGPVYLLIRKVSNQWNSSNDYIIL
jgi:hypothetical protein